MPTIEIMNNVRCRLSGVDKATLSYLDEQLAEQQKGAEWSPIHRRFGGRWDGKRHHFCKSPAKGSGTFPKGLTSRVRTLLAKRKLKAKTVDQRKKLYPKVDTSKLDPNMLEGVSMSGDYAYQLDAIKAALEKEAGVLWMSTNSGKTEVTSAITKTLVNRVVLIVVPKQILLKQTRERLAERLGTIPETIGVIGGGKFDPREVTVAIVNSVTPIKKAASQRAKAKNAILREYLKTVDCVIFDEAHHLKAASWMRLSNALTNAQYRYLMSGTPFTGDNDLMIEAAAGPVIYEIRNDDLIKLGVSAKPLIKLIPIAEPKLAKLEDETWASVNDAGIVLNEHRNRIIANEALASAAQGKSVLILVRILAQGAMIRQFIAKRKPGIVAFAHGKMSDTMRDQQVDWFQAKPGRILVGSAIFDEGVDMPAINVLIVGDGGKSLRAVLQKIGRSLRRKKQGENKVEVVDFADMTHHWLSAHSLDRLDIYVGEGFEIVETQPTEQKEQRKRENRQDGKDRKSVVQALSPTSDQRNLVGAWCSSTAGGFAIAAEQGADAVSQSSDVVLWRFRATQGFHHGAVCAL